MGEIKLLQKVGRGALLVVLLTVVQEVVHRMAHHMVAREEVRHMAHHMVVQEEAATDGLAAAPADGETDGVASYSPICYNKARKEVVL